MELKSLPEIAEFYKGRFGFSRDYFLSGKPNENTRLSVVIPCFDEEPETTLESLGHCSISNAEKVEVILVFNHSENSHFHIQEKHQKQAEKYDAISIKNGILVYSISAFDLPKKHAGVGLARKIGMDAALQRFSKINHDGLMVCLDADCTVSENYLETLLEFETSNGKVASIYFEHPLQNIENQQVLNHILDYEIWLRYYIQALRFAKFPNAFHTIGSSMAVRASAYAKSGGMNRKKAGEDFYFLHKLIPHGDFYDITNCTVFPSSRISERVPFGTGRAMLEMQQNSKDFSQVYHSQIFIDLKEFFESENAIFNLNFDKFPEIIRKFLHQNDLEETLVSLKIRSKTETTFWKNFWQFWDGFQMLKFVHFARDNFYKNQAAKMACTELFKLKNLDRKNLLIALRQFDRRSPDAYF